MTKIAVAGATGRVGTHVVDVLREQAHEVVAMSRATGVDVITGDGLDAALAGVSCIIDAATGPSPDEQEATAFFETSARNLQAAGSRAGVSRIVTISIVGVDGLQGGYALAKVRHERALLAGPIPVVILRATQFYEFIPLMMQWGRQDGKIAMPVMRAQPIAGRAVAEAAVSLALASDPPAMSEIAGPREERMAELARAYAAAKGDTTPIEEVAAEWDPDREANGNGTLLPGPDATLAGPTFSDWLAQH